MGQVIWVVAVIGFVACVPMVQSLLERKRRARYAEYALTHGLHYDPHCTEPRGRLGDGFGGFSRPWNPIWRNAFAGTRGGVPFTAFEYRYAGGGRGSGWHDRSVLLWDRPAPAPDFVVAPEDLGDKILQLFGTQDFDFPEDKEFSGDYRLQGSDEAAVRALFGPGTRAFCVGHAGMYAVAKGRHLVWWREQSLPEPAYLDQFFAEGDAFRQLFFK